jgi:uncharacterized protein
VKKVFLDTVGLVALWDARDQWHDASASAFQKVSSEGAVAVTTDLVLLECGNALSRTTIRLAVYRLWERLLGENRLIIVERWEIENAWREYGMGTVGQAGIVDIISFNIMRRFGIGEAFTNDRHFKTAGFVTLF